MCMRLGSNPQINYFTLTLFELSHLLAQRLPKYIDTRYLVNATPLTFFSDLFETFHVLCQGKV